MLKALKATVIVWVVLHIIMALALIIVPEQSAEMMGFGSITGFAVYVTVLWGAGLLAASIWLIVAVRDVLNNINWVKFTITLVALGLAVQLLTLVRGVTDFSQSGVGIIEDALFLAAFLIFYPYKAAKGGQ